MQLQKRLSLITIGAISLAFIVLITLVTISFRNFGNSHAQSKANITAELVKDGLTAHMVNGIMENREFFLQRMENAKNIHSLWVARSPSVIKQFGKGFNNEIPRDDIDRQVIRDGKIYQELIETTKSAMLRFTVPYKATSYGNPDCMKCHDAVEGETLGTVSMLFDITESRNEGIVTILYIIGVSIIIMLIVLGIINYSLRPFMHLFDSINSVMKNAKEGNYATRVEAKNAYGEGEQVAEWINTFLNKLEHTLDDIQTTVQDFFISKQQSVAHDPLLVTKHIIIDMANIYRFKKTIEFDEGKEQVYGRLASVFKHQFNLHNFQMVESNNSTGTLLPVYNCQIKTHEIKLDCRALRTKQPVSSNQFHDLCAECQSSNKHYLCLPFTISDDFDLLIHFAAPDQEYLKEIKNLLPQIENYIDAARPELVTKNLTEILRHSSTTDQLTGLYNRKFLDEFIEKASAQTLRSNLGFGILMLDIDFFKAVNDTYGHDVGDKVIAVLARVIKTSIREADVAFRYGGEEFLIMLHNCNAENIEEIANKIRTIFGKEIIRTNNSKSFSKTLSIGFSLFPEDSESIWRCIKFSDLALYKAKQTGRNKVVKFDDSLLGEGDLKDTYKP